MNDQEFNVRRGLVLGFTAAEISILLMFLLLLIMGILFHGNSKSEDRINDQSALEQNKPDYESMRQRVALLSTSLIAEVDKRTVYEARAAYQESEMSELKNRIKDLKREVGSKQSRIDLGRREIDRLTDILNETQNQLATSDQSFENARHLSELLENELTSKKQENEQLKALMKKLIDELDRERDRSEKLQVNLVQAESENIRLAQDKSKWSDSDSKGTDSACLYRKEFAENGTEKEQPLYLFDIKIEDQAVLVRYPSKSRLSFDSTKDANFKKEELEKIFEDEIKFDREVLEREKLTFEDFLDKFKGFKAAAQNKKIRQGQRCIFNVALWDSTSNKRSYKLAKVQTVDQIFSSFEYRSDEWPHQ